MLLIIGSGRSGTTWLGKLFDSHPDTVYLHEPDAVTRHRGLPSFPTTEEVALMKEEAARYLCSLRRTRTPGVIGVPPFFEKNYRAGLPNGFHRGTMMVSKALRRVSGRKWAGLPVPLAAEKGSRGLYVLKSVSCVGRAALWAAADPKLKIIHLIRHPGGRIASLERGMAAGLMNPDPQIDELFELPEAELYPFTKEDISKRRFCEQLAFSWMVQNDKAVADMADNPHYRPVIYEDLCQAPADRMAELFAFAGLEPAYQATLFLKRLQKQSDEELGDYHSVMKSPLASIDRWKNELSPDEQDTIMDIVSHARTAPLRRVLGLTNEKPVAAAAPESATPTPARAAKPVAEPAPKSEPETEPKGVVGERFGYAGAITFQAFRPSR